MKKTIALLSLSLLFLPTMPALAADTTRPQVGQASPDHATVGVPVMVTASVSDNESGIASCNLYVNNDDVGPMSLNFNSANRSYTFFQAGIHTMFVFCRDGANNFQSGANTSVFVTPAQGSSDATPPIVSDVSPAKGAVGQAIFFTVSVSDSGTGVSACNLVVDGFSQGAMDVSFGTASINHTFQAPGTYDVYAQCFDGAGNGDSGNAVSFVATTGTDTEPEPEPSPIPDSTPRLIKLTCPDSASSDHPCRAVYYRGADNKRHAFPNANVFFSWYADFSTVDEVSAQEMSAIPLGKQVTYHPGYTLVKFSTLNNVYAVSKGGSLRWITSEAIASAIYGGQWNTKVHDIPDTFFIDYTFSANINDPLDYSPTTELADTPTIDDNFSPSQKTSPRSSDWFLYCPV